MYETIDRGRRGLSPCTAQKPAVLESANPLHFSGTQDFFRTLIFRLDSERQRRRHQPIAHVGEWLRKVVRGYFLYHAVPGNLPQLGLFFNAALVAAI